MTLARNEEDIQKNDCSLCSPANTRVDCYATTKQQHRYYIRRRREEGCKAGTRSEVQPQGLETRGGRSTRARPIKPEIDIKQITHEEWACTTTSIIALRRRYSFTRSESHRISVYCSKYDGGIDVRGYLHQVQDDFRRLVLRL